MECIKNECPAHKKCMSIKESMNISLEVMQAMMTVLHQTTNYMIVKNSVQYDFEMNGINLRNYYNTLLEMSDDCIL